jgi:endoglycosylceramidase
LKWNFKYFIMINKLAVKKIFLPLIALFYVLSIVAQTGHDLRDDRGRHIIGRGFVVTTNDGKGEVFFDPDDYSRMVRLGANSQVIRLELGKLSSFPGAQLDNNYLLKLDSLVAMGRHAGIKSIFKMTTYGVRGFSWEAFWINEKNEHQTYIDAWKVVWNRYKDEPFVRGYDLVNEPRKLTMEISYDDLTEKYLIPLYRKIIDAKDEISPEKYGLIQSIFMNKGEAINGNQYAEIKKPLNRDNVIFAPHVYQKNKELIKPAMLRFKKESELLDAPVFIGEWGFPTFDKTDSTMTGKLGQLNYMDFYIRTAELFDSLRVGSIKAWFSGNRTKQNFLSGGISTWAIFQDKQDVGTVERKYITDIIARPYPQAIAGDIQSFMYDFATRNLDIYIHTDNSKGASRIFIGANRHYPDGFSVVCNQNFVLCYNPLKNGGLTVFKSDENSNPADFIWDGSRQQLVILEWPVDNKEIHLRIIPGINN